MCHVPLAGTLAGDLEQRQRGGERFRHVLINHPIRIVVQSPRANTYWQPAWRTPFLLMC